MDNVVRSSVSCRVVSFPSILQRNEDNVPSVSSVCLRKLHCSATVYISRKTCSPSIRQSLAHHQHHHVRSDADAMFYIYPPALYRRRPSIKPYPCSQQAGRQSSE
jgi:hypothetical protein